MRVKHLIRYYTQGRATRVGLVTVHPGSADGWKKQKKRYMTIEISSINNGRVLFSFAIKPNIIPFKKLKKAGL